MPTIIKVKTWVCEDCGYHCNHEPTSTNHRQFFATPDKKPINVPENACPACHAGNLCGCENNESHLSQMIPQTDTDKLITITVMDESEVDDYVEHRGVLKHRDAVAHDEAAREEAFYRSINNAEFEKSKNEGRLPDYGKAREGKVFQTILPRELTDSERQVVKGKIRADMAFHKAREHN